jgi:electron transport complex protein RnfG
MGMILALTAIAMVSGFLVVLASQLTAPIIAENQRIAIERALVQLIPGSVKYKSFKLVDGKLLEADTNAKGESIYAGYDANGQLSGIAAKRALKVMPI